VRRTSGAKYVPYGDVWFRASSARAPSGVRSSVYLAYLLAFAVWCIVASWRTHPLLGVLSALVFVELGLARVRGLQLAGGYVLEEGTARRIAEPLRELCVQAPCRVPRVSVMMGDASRPAFVRPGRGGSPQLVVSSPFLDQLDDLELRAVLAHEVSHLATGDLDEILGQWLILVAVVGVSGIAAGILSSDSDVALPIYVAGMLVVLRAFAVLLRLGWRRFELRADAGAVRLTRDPDHLVSGLEKATTLVKESRRRVFAGPWRWLLFPLAWRVPSHPKLQDRVARIKGLAASKELAPG